ncbi:SGNH/GDSL hydrolase family protein [Limnofasciculus baicalensis]|uniref:SGNH/GDSL hydrolase family protein n=1 Tax=Limnofasciculus baicalensis BBK-W-15 TaxID=2699891 RepID=A0AAE3KRV0_9CYAN|nr:SGNH/GDSL hydrolase family protein [Limnofasciculus baicalensis]MCP2732043.1 SGNH/GDSL hydrolase family protein [Limnofasciculus baicalensis BBK-W-15]
MKLLLIIVAVLIGLFLLLEVGLRLFWGFGNPLIYIADEKIGYLLAPNQKTKRFGNRISINEYSMRSAAIAKQRPPSTLRVFLLGDSIVNGGWWTDQEQTLSGLIANQLKTHTGKEKAPLEKIEVINASANSWGPRNEVAYLQRFGIFESQALVVVINTDDLFGTAPTSVPVGRDRFYPSQKPPLAIVEAITRFSRYQPPAEMAAVNAEKGDRVGFNLEAIGKIQEIVKQTDTQFLLVMTPLLREVSNPGPRDYEIKARDRLIEFTKEQQITYIDFLPIFKETETPETLYRDHIHLSPEGNKKVTEVISQWLLVVG